MEILTLSQELIQQCDYLQDTCSKELMNPIKYIVVSSIKHYMRKMNYFATHVKFEDPQHYSYHIPVGTAKNINNHEKGMGKRAPFLTTLCTIIDFIQRVIPKQNYSQL